MIATGNASANFCTACGGDLTAGAAFCIHCGAHTQAGAPGAAANPFGCSMCGGSGALLPADRVYCPGCRWLRPLTAEYRLPVEAYLWSFDAEAMQLLRSLGPVTAAAQSISNSVGRPWFEASVNGIRLSERQFPDIFEQAIRAARILSLSSLPEIYISGEAMWDAVTMGTETNAFVVIGSVLTNFKGDDLLYVLAREMGHCQAGHALWRTVSQFVSGRQRRTILGEGMLRNLNPLKVVENVIDAPLMAWARHAEITADRAGLLVVGDEDAARRVLMSWTLKSFPLYQRINQEAWREQEDQADETLQRAAEFTLASTPFIGGRLKRLREYGASELYTGWRAVIQHWSPPVAPTSSAAPVRPGGAAAPKRRPATPAPDPDTIRLVCTQCAHAMRFPRTALAGRDVAQVRCPNAACRAVLSVQLKAPAPAAPPTRAAEPEPGPRPDALTPD